MKRIEIYVIAVFIAITGISTHINAQQMGEFTDSRDGKVYKTVEIGDQVWMAENLNFKTTNSWCYDNDEANCADYGRLYTWDAAKNACPDGWHLPSDDEWTALTDYVESVDAYICNGDEDYIAKALTSKTGWNHADDMCAVGNKPESNNATGFTALPGGIRYADGAFDTVGYLGVWWSSSESDASNAWGRGLGYHRAQLLRNGLDKLNGNSIRCLKD